MGMRDAGLPATAAAETGVSPEPAHHEHWSAAAAGKLFVRVP
jgi:hypothetical protein